MILKRDMGKATRATLQDMRGRVQLYVARAGVGEAAYEAFKHYDLGDILGAKGTLFKTRTGELSVKVTDLRLLVKAQGRHFHRKLAGPGLEQCSFCAEDVAEETGRAHV